MKKLIVITGLFLVCFSVESQNIIEKNSNVGIGTANPVEKLDVYGKISAKESFELRRGTDGSKKIADITWYTPNNGLIYSNNNGGYHAFKNSISGDMMRISPNGNVGIGTVAPLSKLQISGGSNNWNESLQGKTTGTIHLDPENSSNNFGSAITFGASDVSDGEDAQAGIYVRTDGNYGSKMYFSTTDSYAAGSKTAMTITHQGNIGIGTITMGSHKLAVEGSIGAREIKVQSVGWPDFVFEDKYELPTLKEVENHINEKGHLKDIPSAKEVTKNGIYLGEMNSKLLQKIEELTLYTIQQEKKIKVQESNLKMLLKRVEKLERK